MTETTLAAAVREVVVALNARDADTAKAWSSADAWDGGTLPLEMLCRDEHLVLQAAPLLLEAEGRGAARLMGFREDKTRESLWLLFDRTDEGWRCVEATRTRLDAEQFIAKKRTPGQAPKATPTERTAAPTPVLVDGGLQRAAGRLVEALDRGDLDAGRALTEDGRWSAPGDSPERLFRQLAKNPGKAGMGEWRIHGERAAGQLVLTFERGADNLWTVWRNRRGLGWKLVATPTRWEPAGLFVTGTLDEVPAFAALPADIGAAAWAQAIVDASKAGGPVPEGLTDADFQALAAPPESSVHALRIGPAVSLPAMNRAMARIDVVDPANDFLVDERWAVLERSAADAPWRFRQTTGMGSLLGLLDGIEVSWAPETPEEPASADTSEAPPPSGTEGAARAAMIEALRGALAASGMDPGVVDPSKMTKEQIEKIAPQLVGGAFAALIGSLLGKVKEGLDEAELRDSHVTVDLAHERAKRAGKPVREMDPFEQDVSREVRSALRDALTQASEGGEVKVDSDFLGKQGPRLIGSLFGAVAKALIPAEITLDVAPEPGKEAAGPTKVKMELGEMFATLFDTAAKSTQPPNRESDEGEE